MLRCGLGVSRGCWALPAAMLEGRTCAGFKSYWVSIPMERWGPRGFRAMRDQKDGEPSAPLPCWGSVSSRSLCFCVVLSWVPGLGRSPVHSWELQPLLILQQKYGA